MLAPSLLALAVLLDRAGLTSASLVALALAVIAVVATTEPMMLIRPAPLED